MDTDGSLHIVQIHYEVFLFLKVVLSPFLIAMNLVRFNWLVMFQRIIGIDIIQSLIVRLIMIRHRIQLRSKFCHASLPHNT